MKLKCKSCQKTTTHKSNTERLRRPRIFHNIRNCGNITVSEVFVYRCETCKSAFGRKPVQSKEEIKGI